MRECAVQTNSLIGYETTASKPPLNTLPLQWKGRGNRIEVTGASWIVPLGKGTLAPALQNIGRDGWSKFAKEDVPVMGKIQFSSKHAAGSESTTHRLSNREDRAWQGGRQPGGSRAERYQVIAFAASEHEGDLRLASVPSIPPAILTQQVLNHLENSVPTTGGCWRWRPSLTSFEVSKICLAIGAFDHVDVELDVVSECRIEGIEQVAAKLLTAWAGQSSPAPDAPQRMKLEIFAVRTNVLETGSKVGRIAEGLFYAGQIFGRQAIRQVVAKHLIVDWQSSMLRLRVMMIVLETEGSSP